VEALAFLYLVAICLVLLEGIGLAMRFGFLRRSLVFARAWAVMSLFLTLVAVGVLGFRFYFLGANLTGLLLLTLPVVICGFGTLLSARSKVGGERMVGKVD
jgi:hypothetical protein